MPRPVQLSMVEGADRSVGPLPLSVMFGTNADLIAEVAPLYLTGSVLDTTYGRGMWWRRFTPEPFAWHDEAIDGVDFRALPHADRSWDSVCFDPPYVPRHGNDDATMPRDQDFGRQLHLGHVRVLDHANRLGLRAHDLIVHVSGAGPGGYRIREIRRARRAHSYLLVFRVPK
jgi:hypothetical protein